MLSSRRSLAILPDFDRQAPHRARPRDHVAHALRDAEAVRGGHDRQRRVAGEIRDGGGRVVVARVQPGAERRGAEVQLQQLRRRLLHIVCAAREQAAQPLNSWPSVMGTASCRCVRPDLEHVGERCRLALE